MFTSKKILYFIIISLIVVCTINGIDYRSNIYTETQSEQNIMVDFSDSGFFAVGNQGDNISIVAQPGEEDDAAASFDDGNDAAENATTTANLSPELDVSQPVGTNLDNVVPTMPEQTTQSTTTTVPTTTMIFTETAPPAYSTTTQTTTTTTTTTQTTTTTTEKVYTDTGNIHFEYAQVTIYAGALTTVEVLFPIGAQQRAIFSSRDTSIATVRSFSDTVAEITGMSVGSTWIQASNPTGEIAYIKVVVTDFAGEVIRLVNVERANNGLAALEVGNSMVQRAANVRLSESMSYFSHTRPNGQKFSTVAQDIGLSYHYIGENLACGQTTPQQVVSEWMNSPTHRANILSTNYTSLCVAYGIGSDGLPYWVQIFHTA